MLAWASGQRAGTNGSQHEEHRIKHKTCVHLRLRGEKDKDNKQTLYEVNSLLDVCAQYKHWYL